MDPSKHEKGEVITVQLNLHGGKKTKLVLLAKNTVLELYGHVKSVSGVGKSFELLAGFPPKALNEPNQTVKEAGLHMQRITQKV